MRRNALVLPLLLALTSPAHAQSVAGHPRVEEAVTLVETWLDAQRAYEGVPGLSAALVYGQEVIWTGASGTADPETGAPATPRTAYSICSISKLFTAIGVMQLRDAGRLRLDDSVSTLLPWFEIGNRYQGSPPVTVEGLLTHSSGLPRESDHAYWVDPFDFPTREQIRERLSGQEMLYPTARYYQYSNLGLTLAGEIVSELSGMPFESYVRENILDPLGMSATWPDIGDYPHPDRLAAGYGSPRRDGSRNRMPRFAVEGISPAAGFASTAEDLARFAVWMLEVMDSEGDDVLSGNTLREMQRVHWLDPDWETTRGLGFGVYRDRGETYVGHSGECPGFETSIRLHAPSSLASVVMLNANGLSPAALATEMIRILEPAVRAASSDPEEEVDPSSTERTPAEFRRFIGAYDEDPWGGESAVLPWKGGLAVLWLPTMDPLASLTPLEHVEGSTFRRTRDDGEPGEEYVFVEGGDGRIGGLRYHGNTYPRIE